MIFRNLKFNRHRPTASPNSGLRSSVKAPVDLWPRTRRLMALGFWLLTLWPTPFEAQNQSWSTTLEGLEIKPNQSVLVEFHASWCGWCRRMEQEVFPRAEFQRFTQDWLLVRLNYDRGEGAALARDFRVGSLPTLLVLNDHLAEVGRVQGFLPASQLVQALQGVQEEYHQFLRRHQSFVHRESVVDPPAFVQLADFWVQRRDWDRAVVLLERLLEVEEDPNRKNNLRVQLSEIHWKAGRLQLASELLKLLDEPRPALALRAGILEVMVSRSLGNCEYAETLLEQLIDDASTHHRLKKRISQLKKNDLCA